MHETDQDKAIGTDELIALRQITPPYNWQGWAETLAAIRALPDDDDAPHVGH